MAATRYRQVLSQPGVARLLIFAVLARIPLTASGVVLTLHVVITLRRGYAAAGLVAAVTTVAFGVGAPWRGRAVDRGGLRRALVPSLVLAAPAWALMTRAGFAQLLVLAALGGAFTPPIFGVVRQSLAVLVPAELRRTAYSLDGIGTEISFMIGPAVGVAIATGVSTRVALIAISGSLLACALALMALNPPTRSPLEDAGAAGVAGAGAAGMAGAGAVPRRGWFTPALATVLAVTAGATVVLAGTDVAIVAHLREHGAVWLTGPAFIAWGGGSMVGGLVYGTLHREVSPFVMLLLLGVLTMPVGLAPAAPWLFLTILPAASLCAPVIAATVNGVSRRVPEAALGEAMGWHGAALQAGSALGAPLAGVVMDAHGAWSGFAAVGGVGAVLAVAGLVGRRGRAGPDTGGRGFVVLGAG